MRRGLTMNQVAPIAQVVDHPLLDRIDEFKIYSTSALELEPVHSGPNSFNELSRLGLWNHLHSKGVDLTIEAGVAKAIPGGDPMSWTTPDCTGQHFERELNKMIARWHEMRQAIYAIELDVPLTHAVEGPRRYWEHPACYTYDTIGAFATTMGRYSKRCHANRIRVHWQESWPDPHNWPELRRALDTVMMVEPFDRFTLDLNWGAVDNNRPRRPWWAWLRFVGVRWSAGENYDRLIRTNLREMAHWCRSNGVEFGLILGSPMIDRHGRTPAGFVRSAREQWRRFTEITGPPDFVGHQSWEDAVPPATLKDWPTVAEMEQVIGITA